MTFNMDRNGFIVLTAICEVTKHNSSITISDNDLYRKCLLRSNYFKNMDKFHQIIRSLVNEKLIVIFNYQNPSYRISSEGLDYLEKMF